MTDHPRIKTSTTIRVSDRRRDHPSQPCECGEHRYEIECEERRLWRLVGSAEVRHPATGEHAMSDLVPPPRDQSEAG